MDIEFAHHARSFLHTKTVTAVDSTRGPGGVMTAPSQRTHKTFGTLSVKRGAVMTVSFLYYIIIPSISRNILQGTVQFMALDILKAMDSETPIAHLVCHDIESFIWMLCYSVGRRFVCDPPASFTKKRKDDLWKFFNGRFGRSELSTIVLSRGSSTSGPLSITTKFPELFSWNFLMP